jgi:hypothetical protein
MRGTQQQRENLSIAKPWEGENRFLERMYQVAEFQKLYQAALLKFGHTLFDPERLHRQVDELATVLRTAVAEESNEKLARFDAVVAGSNIEAMGFGGRMGPPGGNAPTSGRANAPTSPQKDGSAPDRPSFGGPGFGGPPFGGFGDSMKPIKGFVKVRAESIRDQLDGKSQGLTVGGIGGRPGGPGGSGPGDFGPGMFLAPAWMQALDEPKKGELSLELFTRGFAHWFDSWNTDKTGLLPEEQLRAGIDRDLSPFRGGPRGFFGAPPGAPPPPDDSADE